MVTREQRELIRKRGGSKPDHMLAADIGSTTKEVKAHREGFKIPSYEEKKLQEAEARFLRGAPQFKSVKQVATVLGITERNAEYFARKHGYYVLWSAEDKDAFEPYVQMNGCILVGKPTPKHRVVLQKLIDGASPIEVAKEMRLTPEVIRQIVLDNWGKGILGHKRHRGRPRACDKVVVELPRSNVNRY